MSTPGTTDLAEAVADAVEYLATWAEEGHDANVDPYVIVIREAVEKLQQQVAAQTARAEAATDSAVVLLDARNELREQVQALGGEPCA